MRSTALVIAAFVVLLNMSAGRNAEAQTAGIVVPASDTTGRTTSIMSTVTPACQTGNWVGYHVINTSDSEGTIVWHEQR
jgi:hypothetical protein